MNVICPHTKLHPVTRGVLLSYRLPVDFVNLSGEGDDGYRLLLQASWRAREPFVVVEQDVVPWPGAVEEIHACPAIWCAYSYPWRNGHGLAGVGIAHMLGCAKFSTALMDALPDVWDAPCHWSLCDQRLFFAARDVGIEPHQHRPAVVHLHGIAA